MALDDGRVVFGVPTLLLHVLAESGVEMVRVGRVLAQVACISMNCGKCISTVCVWHRAKLLLSCSQIEFTKEKFIYLESYNM
jgi:hypothetical protein